MVYKNSVGELAVALSNQVNIIGALQDDSLFQIASLLIPVDNAVLAVAGEVLRQLASRCMKASLVAISLVVTPLTLYSNWVPPLIVAPNLFCFLTLKFLYQFWAGMFSG